MYNANILQLCSFPPLPPSDLFYLHSYSNDLMTSQIYPPPEGALHYWTEQKVIKIRSELLTMYPTYEYVHSQGPFLYRKNILTLILYLI